jgi:hypothetical protein
MSKAHGKMVELWDGIIQYYEEPVDAKTEVFEAAIDAGLTAFETHKENLLAVLRNAYEHGPKSEPFDADKAWRRLTFLAGTYVWEARIKPEIIPPTKRRKRLRAFERAMGKARAMADQAMQDDVGDDLYGAWCKANIRYDADFDPKPPVTLVRIIDEFKKVVASLSILEAAASHAADDVLPRRSGKPANLAIGYIRALAEIYRESTGREPGTGRRGPFTRFVMQFRAALDPSYKTTDETGGQRVDETMVDAIKLALGKRRKRPRRSNQPKRRPLIPYAGQRK